MKLAPLGARSGASILALVVAAGGIAGQAHAAAFYLADQSTVATGRAYSGEAAQQGAQQQFFNPAAIGGITGVQNYFGLTAILPHANAVNIDSTVTRPLGGATTAVGGAQRAHNPVNNGYLPNGGIAIGLGKIAIGFTMASPYSFTSNYDKDSFVRYSADKTRLRTFDFQPSIAYAPNSHISFGAGPEIDYVRATFANYLPDPLSSSNPDGHQYLKGAGWDVGYTFGFQYHDDKVDIGASYKSSIKHDLKGHLIIDEFSSADPLSALLNQRDNGVKASFRTPWQVAVSLRYHVTPTFTVESQITRFGWDEFNKVSLSNLGSLIGDQSLPENYKNSFAYSVGFDYTVSPKLTVRGGVARDLSPVTSGNRDPRVPDGSRWDYASGLSYEVNHFMGIDASAEYAHIASNPIDSIQALFASTILTGSSTQNDAVLKNARALVFSLGGHLTF